jgi:flagellar biosynthetic protein FliO
LSGLLTAQTKDRPAAWLLVTAFVVLGCVAPLRAAPAPSPTPAASAVQTPPAAQTPSTQPATPSAESDRLPFMAEAQHAGDAPSAAGLLARTFGALLLIVGLIVAGAWGLKKFGGARFGAAAEDAPTLRVVSTVPLGDKRSLAVVRFGTRTLLVGCTPQAMTLLAEEKLTDEVNRADGAGNEPPFRSVADLLSSDDPDAFAAELAQAEAQFDKAGSGEEDEES